MSLPDRYKPGQMDYECPYLTTNNNDNTITTTSTKVRNDPNLQSTDKDEVRTGTYTITLGDLESEELICYPYYSCE